MNAGKESVDIMILGALKIGKASLNALFWYCAHHDSESTC